MNNDKNEIKKVTNVIEVLQGGIDFYEDAMHEVTAQNVKSTFQRMIAGKREAIETLQPFAIKQKGERETDSDWMVDTRKMYTNLIGKMSSDKDHTYIKQLEEVEDKLLESIDDALEEDQSPECIPALRQVRVQAQKMHDEMKALQKATS